MQIGNHYEVCTSYYGFCMCRGEFKTLEPAKDLFYKLVKESVENKGIPYKYDTSVYMLEWSKDLDYRKTILDWELDKGYVINLPRKPKSIIKIIKQLYIRRKVQYIHSKCSSCSPTLRMFCKNIPNYCKGPHYW